MKYHNIVSPKNENFYFSTPVKNHGNTAVFIILVKIFLDQHWLQAWPGA